MLELDVSSLEAAVYAASVALHGLYCIKLKQQQRARWSDGYSRDGSPAHRTRLVSCKKRQRAAKEHILVKRLLFWTSNPQLLQLARWTCFSLF